MPQVDADPEALRKLRAELQRSQNDIKAAVQRIRSALKSTHWNDTVREQFERDLDQTLRVLNKFDADAAQLSAYLNKKASELDIFLRR